MEPASHVLQDMLQLTPKQRRALRARAHALKPVVTVGQAGLTPAVLREIDLSLAHHELIKVKLAGLDRTARQRVTAEICRRTGSAWVQHIGRIAVLYRPGRAEHTDIGDS